MRSLIFNYYFTNVPDVSPSSRQSGGDNGESALVLLGGQDEEQGDSVEVLTADGACHLVEGFPAPMPEGDDDDAS